MEASIPKPTDPINDQKTEPRVAALKRFLDRLLSQPQPSARIDEENRQTAVELGLADAGSAGTLDHGRLVDLTRGAIRGDEPQRQADQGLEIMSAPPAQPADVP